MRRCSVLWESRGVLKSSCSSDRDTLWAVDEADLKVERKGGRADGKRRRKKGRGLGETNLKLRLREIHRVHPLRFPLRFSLRFSPDSRLLSSSLRPPNSNSASLAVALDDPRSPLSQTLVQHRYRLPRRGPLRHSPSGRLSRSLVPLTAILSTMATPAPSHDSPRTDSPAPPSSPKLGATPLPRRSSTETFDPVFDLDLEKRLERRDSSGTIAGEGNAVVVSASSSPGPVTLSHDDPGSAPFSLRCCRRHC